MSRDQVSDGRDKAPGGRDRVGRLIASHLGFWAGFVISNGFELIGASEKRAEFALLQQAEAMLGVGYSDAAGRVAYLAGFHAAQALIFERNDRVFKTHKGVQVEFARIVADEPGFEGELRASL